MQGKDAETTGWVEGGVPQGPRMVMKGDPWGTVDPVGRVQEGVLLHPQGSAEQKPKECCYDRQKQNPHQPETQRSRGQHLALSSP